MLDIKDKIIAHRGASYNAPENTLLAIELAWKQGIQRVEVDIQKTKDHHLVVFHDDSLSRLCNVDRQISEVTLQELKRYDVGSWKGSQFKGEKIPTLQEVLQTIPDHHTLVIEVKSDLVSVPFIFKEVQNYLDRIEFISFHYEVVCVLKKKLPNAKVLWLLDLDYTEETYKEMLTVDEIVKKVKEANLDGIDVWAGEVADDRFVNIFKEQGLSVYIWTINDISTATYFLNLGVEAITTDRPKWIIDQI